MINEKVRVLAERLLQNRWTVTTAESCTGGAVATRMTDLAGSSAWFNGAFVTYSNRMKSVLLGVSVKALDQYGPVSEEVVEQMAFGALERAEADLSVAISGIAGPEGGSEEKPVGTVYFAWALKGKPVTTARHCFVGDRQAVRAQAVECALQGLLDKIG